MPSLSIGRPFRRHRPATVIHTGCGFTLVSVTPMYAFCALLQDMESRLIENQPSIIFCKDLANHLVPTMTYMENTSYCIIAPNTPYDKNTIKKSPSTIPRKSKHCAKAKSSRPTG